MEVFRAGGVWHVTDMRRGESIFEIDPNAHEEVERGFELEGSNLSGVSARCSWTEQDAVQIRTNEKLEDENVSGRITERETEQIKNTLQKGLQFANPNFKGDELGEAMMESSELLRVKKLEGVHLVFNLEAGSLLPLAIRYTYTSLLC